MALSPHLRDFPDLSHHAFQHQYDRSARTTLERIPLATQIVRFISERFVERLTRVQQISSSIRVSSQQYPSLYKQYVRMAQVLDLRRLPDLYIQAESEVNAYTLGVENYTIVVNSGLVDCTSEDELLAVIGHELGHVKCDHMLYSSAAEILRQFGSGFFQNVVPPGISSITQLANAGIQVALLDWYRKAELSCDRAALLATQNLDSVCGVLSKFAGHTSHLSDEISIEALRQQAADFQDIGADSLLEKLMKASMMSGQTHPYPIVRINELCKWAESPEYQQILNGQYRLIVPDGKGQAMLAPPLETPSGVRCPKCAAVWPTGVSYCGRCASNIRNAPPICGQCHHPIDAEWAICAACGNRLRTA